MKQLTGRFVDALVLMGTEVIALSLQKIGRDPLGPQPVIVWQGGRERRDPMTMQKGGGSNAPPGPLNIVHFFSEEWVKEVDALLQGGSRGDPSPLQILDVLTWLGTCPQKPR